MTSSPATTAAPKTGRSEEASLLFGDRNNQFDDLPRAIDLGLLAPLVVGMAAAIFFALIYTYLLQRLG